MQIFLLLLAACFSGVFAGMGMGGGTFLIPVLSLFFGVSQIICQSTNVICFSIVAVICSVIYVKNKLVDYKVVLCVVVPATALATIASVFAIKTSSAVLQFCFSCFIILLGIFYFVRAIKQIKKNRH